MLQNFSDWHDSVTRFKINMIFNCSNEKRLFLEDNKGENAKLRQAEIIKSAIKYQKKY